PHKDNYLQALNFRAITETGGSNGSLVNIKGNECKISFPTIRNIFKLKVYNNNGVGLNETVTITINGQVATPITITNSTTGFDLYNTLSLLSNCYNNPNSINPTFALAYENDYIIIYQQPIYNACGPIVNSQPLVISI